MSGSTITLPAFAKINWTLHILGKRADGCHELETIFQTISLHDTITLAITDDERLVLFSDDRSLPTGAGNLARGAAAALQGRYAIRKGARIRIAKRIPLRAGLGGGSANAAVTLMGLAYLWQIGAAPGELVELAAGIGADVPFFLYGGTARGSGTGTDITPLADASQRFLAVVKPDANVATENAYEALQAPSLTTLRRETILLGSSADPDRKDFALSNDFDSVVSSLEPEIVRARESLLRAGARDTLLAGSGSAIFGVFDNKETMERAILAISLEAGWRVFPCSTVGRDQYRRAMGPCGAMLACASDRINAGA